VDRNRAAKLRGFQQKKKKPPEKTAADGKNISFSGLITKKSAHPAPASPHPRHKPASRRFSTAAARPGPPINPRAAGLDDSAGRNSKDSPNRQWRFDHFNVGLPA